MQINKKLLFLSLLAVILISPSFVFAQVTAVSIITNIATVLNNVILVAIIIAWLITGLLFLMAVGNPNLIGTGKKAAIASIIGTIIYVLSSVALQIIRSAILQGQ